MFRGVMVAAVLFILVIQAQAQSPAGARERGIFRYDLAQHTQSRSVKPLDGGDLFIDPTVSLLKLRRQLEFQFLPPDFFPTLETEPDSFKRQALRYGIAYYRDCEVPGLDGFYDVLLGMRFDTRNGPLDVKYFHVATIINTNKVQFPEDRAAMAILQTSEGSAMLFFFEGTKQELFTFEGLFTEDPHAVNFFAADDVQGVKADLGAQKFAVFVRGGADRASLFAINTDSSLKDLQTYEVIHDLLSTDRAYIFEILPALVPYRGASVK